MNFHRLPGELVAVATIPITATTSAVTDVVTDDVLWTRVIGPFGGLFLSIVFLGIFLRKDAIARKDRLKAEAEMKAAADAREKKEEERRKAEEEQRERRHSETLALQEKNSKQLVALTVAGIRREGKTEAAIEKLAAEMKSRPCAK